jgi:hypothetical protein
MLVYAKREVNLTIYIQAFDSVNLILQTIINDNYEHKFSL